MNKYNIINIGLLCVLALFNSCSGRSASSPVGTRGNWTKEDKIRFETECKGVQEIKDLGRTGVKLCDCMLSKSERTFNSFREADNDELTMTSIANECSTEITSKKRL